MNDVAKTAADMLRMGVEPCLEVEIELRAENDKLREQRDELLNKLLAASNYIDVLGGVSGSYRQVITETRGEA